MAVENVKIKSVHKEKKVVFFKHLSADSKQKTVKLPHCVTLKLLLQPASVPESVLVI